MLQEFDYLKPYLDATASSTSRHRTIVAIIVTTSILIFGTLWNSVWFGWFNSRVKVLESSHIVLTSILEREKLVSLNKLRQRLKTGRQSSEQEVTETKNAITDLSKEIGYYSDGEVNERIIELNSLIDKELIICRSYLDYKVQDLYSLENFNHQTIENSKITALINRIEPMKTELQHVKSQNAYLIKIPFFGIAFEVNDLGLLGGTTFIVLLIWFRLSLWTEVNNLQFISLTASSEHIKFCYHYLAMQQVLTIPPEYWERKDIPKNKSIVKLLRHKPWKTMPQILYCLPAFIQTLVFIYDCISIKIGVTISSVMTYFSISASFIFLVLIFVMTYLCLQLTKDLDKVWKVFAEEAKKGLIIKA